MGADNQNLKLRGNSVDNAAYMWNAINNEILAGYEAKSFEEPSGIKHMKVDTISGKLPTEASYADYRGTVKEEIFGPNNYPKEEDDIHEWAYIDSRNNLLASNVTPKFYTQTRSVMVLKNEYDPNKFNGIYPKDWAYRMPKAYSTLVYEPPKVDDKDKDKEKDKDKDKDKEEKEKDEDNQNENENTNSEENSSNLKSFNTETNTNNSGYGGWGGYN